jgi:hypothetical protein
MYHSLDKIFIHYYQRVTFILPRDTDNHDKDTNLEKTQRNIDFHGIIDFLTRTTINYSLLVNPEIIGPWI